jgi:hypothetical protein
MNIETPEFLETYSHQLHDAIERDLARAGLRARLKRRALGLGVPTVAAATAAAVLLSAGGAGGPAGGPALASAAIIRGVSAELAGAPGSILHEVATVTLLDGTSTSFELWVQTGGTEPYRVIKFGQEVSQSATQNEIYDRSSNTVTVSPLPPGGHASSVRHSPDLADELKQMVDSGHATATQTTFDGIPAYELRILASGDTSLNGTAYVAQSDYRPLEIDSTWGKAVFSAYEHLPATPANEALLAVTTAHPGATVVNEGP